ncbi:glutamine synthetase type III, partial [bacterium]|nr:glutamine synthetase type III [bacterium]
AYMIDLGLNKLPAIMQDNTDRNRTSPFAFTGNKFEFRALGSSASVSLANTVLSAAVADAIDDIIADIEDEIAKGIAQHEAILTVLRKYIIESEPIRFEGNNYSAEWAAEAEKRGLPNVKRTGHALEAFVKPANMEMLMRQGVFSKNEIIGRYNTKLEQYITTLEIEVSTFLDLMLVHVLPAAIRYQGELLNNVTQLRVLADVLPKGAETAELDILKAVTTGINDLKSFCDTLVAKNQEAEEIEDLAKKASFFADNIVDLLENGRKPAEKLEMFVPDSMWTLPKYSEMLFIM